MQSLDLDNNLALSEELDGVDSVGNRFIEAKFISALDQGNVRFAYQPQQDLATGRLIGAEALVRWTDQRRAIPPDEFIPALAPPALSALTHYTIEQTCNDIAAFGFTTPVSLNVDPAVLNELPTLIEHINQIPIRTGIRPEQLVLEITEPTPLMHTDYTKRKLQQIRDMGCKISIDDFGTGYSNFSRLVELPVDEVKIDRSISGCLLDDEDMYKLTRAIITVAKEVNVTCVAEGIENQETLDALRELGCDYAQGYYIGMPMPPEEFCLLG